MARELDARAKTKDRFVTALALSTHETGLLFDAARRETSEFASTVRVGEHLRLRAPGKKALWLLLPLAALGLLEGLQEWRANRLAPELAIAQKLIEQVRRAAHLEAKKDNEFQKIFEQLQDTERQLARCPSPCEKLSGLSPSWNKNSRRYLNWTMQRRSRSLRPSRGITQNWPRIFALERMPTRQRASRNWIRAELATPWNKRRAT